ncbi:hypothetical protein [Clostridium sp.]
MKEITALVCKERLRNATIVGVSAATVLIGIGSLILFKSKLKKA